MAISNDFHFNPLSPLRESSGFNSYAAVMQMAFGLSWWRSVKLNASSNRREIWTKTKANLCAKRTCGDLLGVHILAFTLRGDHQLNDCQAE